MTNQRTRVTTQGRALTPGITSIEPEPESKKIRESSPRNPPTRHPPSHGPSLSPDRSKEHKMAARLSPMLLRSAVRSACRAPRPQIQLRSLSTTARRPSDSLMVVRPPATAHPPSHIPRTGAALPAGQLAPSPPYQELSANERLTLTAPEHPREQPRRPLPVLQGERGRHR